MGEEMNAIKLFSFFALMLFSKFSYSIGGNEIVFVDGDRISIRGKFSQTSGVMPRRGEKWMYDVVSRNVSEGILYDFTFWSMNEMGNSREGRESKFHAKSWTIQFLDSKYDSKNPVVFDDASDFYFWGSVRYFNGYADIRISKIYGLPKISVSPFRLKIPLSNTR